MLAPVIALHPRQVLGQEVDSLLTIFADDVNLALWQRGLPLHLQRFAETLLNQPGDVAESMTLELESGSDAEPDLRTLLMDARDLAHHAALVADVAYLVRMFACLFDARRVGLRVRTLDKAMCPRWHVDQVPVRLITTYAGPGSEWLAEGNLPRRRLGHPGCDEFNELPPAGRMQPGEVGLLKGERWAGNEGRGIVHRSPQPSAGQRRLMLTLDWLG